MENIQSTMKELFGNSCLAYCYAYIAHPSSSIHQLTACVLKGWSEHNIDDDGFVSRPVQYYNSLMPADNIRIRDICKIDINNLNELPETGMFSVEFKLKRTDRKSHFVVCKRGKIVFDPSGDSNTCKYGVPVSYRELMSCSSDDWVVRNKELL